MYIYIYIYTYIYIYILRDNNLYTTTNKYLQCLLKIMCTVLKIIGVYV